jgi:hypothetical protein
VTTAPLLAEHGREVLGVHVALASSGQDPQHLRRR